MKAAFLLFFPLLLLSSFAPTEFNKEIVGKLKLKKFSKDKELKQWYAKEFNAYHPTDSILQKLKEHLEGKQIVVVLGTWCSDSQREFPRLIKVLAAIDFPAVSLKIYGVNKTKSAAYDIVNKYKIMNVPTIIVLDKDEKEIERIVENVKVSTEADLLH